MDNPVIYYLSQVAKFDNEDPQLTETERDRLLEIITRLLKTEDVTTYICRQQLPWYRRLILKMKELISFG
jgi:hypothetical protein